MNLYERYLRKETRELVHVLEIPHDYQPEVIKIANEILADRKEPYEKLIVIAENIQRKEIISMLNNLDPLNDELKIPVSHFLSKTEIKDMLQEEFEKFLEDKDSFRFDVWKYSIGGI